MVTQNNSTTVPFVSTDLIGQRVYYRHSSPDDCRGEIAVWGEIVSTMDHRGATYIEVKPEPQHLITKWVLTTAVKQWDWMVQ